LTYSIALSDGTPIDPSLIAFTASPPAIYVYSTLATYIGTHNLTLIGTNTIYPTKTASASFILIVTAASDPCLNATITTTDFKNQSFAYDVGSATLVNLDWEITNNAGCSISTLTYTLSLTTLAIVPSFV
jgi:hypothetical protein